MAKKNVFSSPTASESHHRNAFDRSFEINFQLSNGMLIPTFCKFCFGHSHVRINQRSFMRTAEVNKAAFPALPMYTDYFFVPMHQILSNWNAFRSRTNDRYSSRLGVPARLPAFNKASLQNWLGGYSQSDRQRYDAIRLLDMLDYGWSMGQVDQSSIDSLSGFDGLSAIGDVTPLALCAYQKVYYDHFRNTAYEANDVAAYNLDDLYTLENDSEVVGTIDAIRLNKFLTLRYVNYRRDFLNTVYPSLNFVSSEANGFQSVNTLPASVLNGYVTSAGSSSYLLGPNFNGMFVNINSTSNSGSNAPNFSLQSLRASFALEKLLRVSAFTPQHVKDQMQARFGYTPKSATMHESVRLGSFKNDIIIGEVTATATTAIGGQTTYLGSVGGKGVGAGDYEKPISYDVPEDGMLIGVTYVLPRSTYDANKVDAVHQQFVPEDWSLPEYDNLGLQPLYVKNYQTYRLNTETDSEELARNNQIMGYQPRDMQYKASISTNHGLFQSNRYLADWVLHGKGGDLVRDVGSNGVDASYFKATPSDINSLFVDSYDGTPLSDQFYGNMVIQFACIQDKPIFGIPSI